MFIRKTFSLGEGKFIDNVLFRIEFVFFSLKKWIWKCVILCIFEINYLVGEFFELVKFRYVGFLVNIYVFENVEENVC